MLLARDSIIGISIPSSISLLANFFTRSIMHHHVTNSLVTLLASFLWWCIMERVKRLASNKIELGMKVSTIESRASNLPMDKRNYICCHKGSTDQDLHRICRNQYKHLGSDVGYWPERYLGHVYIVLEPVGSARLTFDDDFVLYELCDLVNECCLESRMRSWTWQGVSKWSRGKDWYI